MYTLRKLAIEEGQISAVRAGHSECGNLSTFKNGKYAVKSASLEDIKVGDQVLVSTITHWLNTSPIREIVSYEPGIMVFKTQTSEYELSETL